MIMKDLSKWIYRIFIVLLIVMAIDLNSDWLRSPKPNSTRYIVMDLIIGGGLVLLFLFSKIKKRL
jgi:hypothetical protein